MARYRDALPQLDGRLFLTDGGLETTLIFHKGRDLPYFAAFVLLSDPHGRTVIGEDYRAYAAIARRLGTGLILESATWRASSDWGTRLGYSREALAKVNRQAITLLEEIRDEVGTEQMPLVVSGCIGPRGDGYIPDDAMTATAAEDYHREQVETFAGTNADMVCAMTMNAAAEAVGIARAAREAGIPVAVSLTVETDGRLPTGQALFEAIEEVDGATADYPAYYMINCAHPTHFERVLTEDRPSLQRIRGLRANASCKSHAELDQCLELDEGDPAELGGQYAGIKSRLKELNVMGGCCGTDQRHIEQIGAACVPLFR